ncbi:hypothetical protein EVAR_94369_1 [Eumeta japonica]|uniref:Uncharacterized protein n=1 Tax=Eumeta variegata TaxID=151549 RepID=A0A4C1TPX7_EUMVA|nr:hypothetical protein EVAR_94369_1 [Eumeta japonica]
MTGGAAPPALESNYLASRGPEYSAGGGGRRGGGRRRGGAKKWVVSSIKPRFLDQCAPHLELVITGYFRLCPGRGAGRRGPRGWYNSRSGGGPRGGGGGAGRRHEHQIENSYSK